MQLKKIRIYGRLRKFLGQSYFEAAVSSPAEAFCFLLANFPEVEKHMSNQFYKIKMNNTEIDLDYIEMKGQGDIQIIPVATGSGPLAAAIGGAIKIGGAIFGAVKAVSAVPVLGTVVKSTLFNVGINLVNRLITPTQSPPQRNIEDLVSQNDPIAAEAFNSFGFSTPTNTSNAGVPIPIIYGEVYTGSVVISSGIDTDQTEGFN